MVTAASMKAHLSRYDYENDDRELQLLFNSTLEVQFSVSAFQHQANDRSL